MKRIVIGSILFCVFFVVGLFGATSLAELIYYEAFWAVIWGLVIFNGIKSVKTNKRKGELK